MKYRVRAIPAAAVVVAMALLSGGCSTASGSASAPPVEKHNVIVGAVPVADSAALYIAQQRGLFKAAGLNVKIETVVSGATAIKGQLAGQYDVVLGNYVSYILADAQQGDKFRVLAPGAADTAEYSAIMVPPSSTIQSVSQLKGKTIGVNALGNIATLFIASMLAEYNLGMQADHIRLKAIPFPLMTHALLAHQIDAAWMVEPFVTTAAMAGATPLADTNQGATENFPLGGYMATQAWEQKYPGTAAAFRHALLQGQEIASRSQPAVWAGLEKFPKIPASVAVLIQLPSYPLVMLQSELQRVANLMLQYNMLDSNFDVSPMLHWSG